MKLWAARDKSFDGSGGAYHLFLGHKPLKLCYAPDHPDCPNVEEFVVNDDLYDAGEDILGIIYANGTTPPGFHTLKPGECVLLGEVKKEKIRKVPVPAPKAEGDSDYWM